MEGLFHVVYMKTISMRLLDWFVCQVFILCLGFCTLVLIVTLRDCFSYIFSMDFIAFLWMYYEYL